MPIIAESGPLIFDPSKEATPTPSPVTPTPKPPVTTPKPAEYVPTDQFTKDHELFITAADQLHCFKREDMPQLTDADFYAHMTIAQMDKYIVQSDDQYCTMQGVKNLANKLKRFRD